MDLQTFDFQDQPVRVVPDADGTPWFLLADLVRLLGLSRDPAAVAERIPADEQRRATLRLAEGSREVTRERVLVSEPGMWRTILRSDSPKAEPITRWVTHEVLPAIRKTGTYSAAPARELSGPELMAKALIEADATIKAQTKELEQARPRARAWDSFISAKGDFGVREAAKVLARDHGIDTGERRLFAWLEQAGWIFRNAGGRYEAYGARVDQGHLAMKHSPPRRHPVTGEEIAVPPTIRVTARGVDLIAKRMTERAHEPQLALVGAGS